MKKKIIEVKSSSLPKPLKLKLVSAVHKVLKENKSQLTDKMERVLDKFVKNIIKKTDKQLKKELKQGSLQ